MSRPGDWNCRSCQHLNFQRRDMCQRCGDPKSGGGGCDFGALLNGGGRGGSGFGYGGSDQEASTSICRALEDCPLLVLPIPPPPPPPVLVPPLGNLVTGFAPGRDAMNITLRVGWNALDAVLQKTRINKANVLLHQVLGMLRREQI
ncbi:hypothetical protein SDJN03_00130, partial [Cucurbita argyrosperma subsp. sororia]